MVVEKVKAGKLTLAPYSTSIQIEKFSAEANEFGLHATSPRITTVHIDMHFDSKGHMWHPVLKSNFKHLPGKGETDGFPFWFAKVEELSYNCEIVHKTIKLGGKVSVKIPMIQNVVDLEPENEIKVRVHGAAADAPEAPAAKAKAGVASKKRKRPSTG